MTPRPDALPLDRASLAYENPDFLNSPDGRIFRIMAEYSEPLQRFRRERIQDTVVFFGSARFAPVERTAGVAAATDPSGSNRPTSMRLLSNTGSAESAPQDEQPADVDDPSISGLRQTRARTATDMARYYEDARTLARMLTAWSKDLPGRRHRFVVTSGGGPGIMEAANRGAHEAGGKTIGLNIKLPFEQMPNPYITPSLNFEFHYFFMRKFWFAYMAKALVVFPGGFGTLDEMFELLTLAQTHKLAKQMTIVIYGRDYWSNVINLDLLAETGAISLRDKDLFRFADTPEQAFNLLRDGLQQYLPSGNNGTPASQEDTADLGPEITPTTR